MKPQILFCVLIVSGNVLLADEPGSPRSLPIESSLVTQAAATVPTPAPAPAPAPDPAPFAGGEVVATAAATEPLTAPPQMVGPGGQPVTSQYQSPPPVVGQPGMVPQPGMAAPSMDPFGNPMVTPGMPYGSPCGPGGCGPGGCGPAGCGPGAGCAPPCPLQPNFVYTAMTPDVTMVPTTVNGPLPNRAGWIQRYELGVLPFSAAKDGWDRLGEWTFDLGWKHVAPLYPIPAIFSFEQQYDLRILFGPSSPAGEAPTNLPGSLHRIGWDFELKTALPSAWNVVVAFNPSIDSDFQSSLTKDAWNWDGRAALLYTPSRELTCVLGVVCWDRLHEQVLPWAGVIWRPNPYWQFDLVFPQFRISTYLWDEFGFRTSLYARVEYHSEAYQILNTVTNQDDRVQMTDWRALIGVNKDRGDMAYFVEGGWIFHRDFDYKVSPAGGFQVDTGAIIRAGLRF